MRAARLHGARDIRLDDIPEPSPGDGEVLLRPLFTGLCGSDLHVWHSGSELVAQGPVVLGHEFSAEVVEVGAGVTDPRLAPGARVAVEPMWTCGECAPCRRGAYNLCRRMVWHGLSDRTGGLGELTVVGAAMAHPLPPSLDAMHGALVEPVAVAHHAVGRSGVAPGGSALVLGAGPIGVASALDLAARGVGLIIVSEPAALRRTAVQQALAAVGAESASHVLDPAAVDVPSAVRELTSGDGVDTAIDAAGVEPAFQAALTAVGPGGKVVVVAVHTAPVAFNPLLAFMGEIDVLASCAYCNDFPAVIDLMERGRFPVDSWVQQLPMTEVARAFETIDAQGGGKLLIDVRA